MAFTDPQPPQRPAPEIKLAWRCGHCHTANFTHRLSCSMCGGAAPPAIVNRGK